MASKVVIVAGLVLVIAAICYAETELEEKNADAAISRWKRGPLGWFVIGFGDGLKLTWDGLNKGVKGLITGLTHAFFGFFAAIANGLQLWRIGIYRALNGIVDFVVNLLTLIFASPLHSIIFGGSPP